MISIVAFAFGVYLVIVSVYGSPPTISNQNERIYFHSTDYYNPFDGYAKISDMKPGSYGYFIYPSSYNSEKWNSYQRFLLIRLPTWLGGDKNDVSSFRAYSQLDIASHCLLLYRGPQYSQQNIQDPCWFEQYRIIDGASAFQSEKFLVKPIENALPQLDLVADNDGYLYVKPPIWTKDKNGVVGDGRILPISEVRKSSEFLLQSYKKMSGINFEIPLQLQTGEFLLFINTHEHGAEIDYQNLESWNGGARLTFDYCNCSKPILGYNNMAHHWESRGITALVIDQGIHDPKNKNADLEAHMFIFVKNSYQISLSENKPFQVIADEVLNDFFNDTSNSMLQKMPT